MSKSNFIAFAIFILSVFFGKQSLAQGKIVNRPKADQFKTLYQKSAYVAAHSSSEYKFVIENNKLTVRQNDKIDFITLKSNVNLYYNTFYNNNVVPLSGSLKYSCGKGGLRSNKVFGNYEVNNIFYTDAKLAQYSTQLLYEGTEVTFKSTTEYTDPKYLTKVFFQDDVPIHKREISFVIPNNVEVELLEMNFDNYEIIKQVEETPTGIMYKYTCNKLKKQSTEPNSVGYLYYAPHFVIATKTYQTASGEETVVRNVDDLYKWYHSLTAQVNVDTDCFKDKVKELTATASTDEDKIKAIYYWVQEKIKYIAFEDGLAGFKPDEPQNVFTKRYGDCKGMAILTKHMLKEAGFDARLTWIGTNIIPYNYNIPSLAVDNHMICTLNHNNTFYVLDATEKYMALGNNAERIQGQEMLIENGDQFLRKTVPVNNAIANQIDRSETIQIKNDRLIGEGKVSYEGESKKDILYVSTNSKVDDQVSLFDYLSVSSYSNSDEVKVNNIPEANRDLPLEIDYTYVLNNKVSNFDGELFISCDWRNYLAEADIDTDRESDFYFGRKIYNQIQKNIEIPSSYKVEYLPDAIQTTIGDVSIELSYQVQNNKIIYTNKIVIPHGIVKKQHFETWNHAIKKVNQFYNDQIILSKK
ncbi:transglutaminase-like domain-containing protein [Saccharicrinis aurantiacus]|uniref:transglutaminase-like domain-containing protein n=1 Tax=Saccharicrinis aurantiacus TaxID=1849719 RepID=UPI002490858E|nr:transglutaminase-like domain-containing protein [Saccharicrinis aurantiacus]